MAKVTRLHHTQVKQAQKLGFSITVEGSTFRAQDAAGTKIADLTAKDVPTLINLCAQARNAVDGAHKGPVSTGKQRVVKAPKRRTADDEDYDGEGEDDAAEEDAANDELDAEEEVEAGSVVKAKYKAIYAKNDDPDLRTTCGDLMAQAFAKATKKDDVLDMEAVLRIARANKVPTDQYNREGRGWQGRLRMSVGNVLRGRIRNGLDVTVGGTTFQGQPKKDKPVPVRAARKAKIR